MSLLAVMVVSLGALSVTGQAKTSKANQVKAAYIIDAKTGQAVYAQNADKKLPIASLSKLMTLYLVETAIKEGKIKWTDNVPIKSNVRKMATSSTLSTMPMAKKYQFTVRQLFAATLVGSSNSSAIALGEYVGGSNAKFIAMMNAQAKKWDLEANFVSASGLDNTDLTTYQLNLKGTSDTAQNLVSAKAITIVAQHLVNEYPDIVKVSNQSAVKIHGYRVPTSVLILKGQSYYDARVKVDGLKTGYTDQAGGCLVATFHQNGRRMIATTLGSKWKFTANNNLRLMLKQQEVYHQVAPTTVNYRVPGTKTTLSLVAASTTSAWENQKQPLQATQQLAVSLLKNRPNYLAARTPVMRLRLTDPLSGTTTTIQYVTPTAVTIGGPMQWATTTTVKQPLNLNLAFAN
ncbi:D-alanyl-D-alanine carboxypeptidase family protein [Lactiplantibacillus daowaiensis]|uniref:D-alanyl-D-alanine carboxypeptidase family protein n=2 Tax=Lactiplantibacillus daowaiensis TaxID=2559918 RepID=A0ABW1RWS3_9LACO|nr:serine hydrolase [Lactiplantibacillus daowaiensis]